MSTQPLNKPKIPKKYQPYGFEILHEDLDVIAGCKTAGALTVAALFEKNKTVHNALNSYIRKGNTRSQKSAFVVHRLDQWTSGVLIFAKSEQAQQTLKNNWKSTVKHYYAIIHGHMSKKSGIIESYLSEDEDYVVHSSRNKEDGKLAQTEYTVVKEVAGHSLVKINLLTGKKNQIRVHFADQGHPLVGDTKYGKENDTVKAAKNMMLHSFSIEFTHPHHGKRLLVQADVPDYFKKLIQFDY